MTSAQYTTLAAWPLAICQALEAQGIDPDPLLKEAGLNHEQFRNHPDDRIDVRKMTAFWQSLEQATGESSFGLKVASYVQPMHFRALGMLLLTMDNLESALDKVVQYYSLVSNSVTIRLEYQSHLIGFIIEPIANVEISDLAIDGFFASLFRFAIPATTTGSFIEKVELLRKKPSNIEPWLTCFQAPVEFDASKNCLWLKRDALQNANTMGDQKLATFNESVVQDYVSKLNSSGFAKKVSQIILNQLDKHEPSLASVAEQLEMGERTLRRHLQEEGQNFRQLLQHARMEMAIHYLLESPLTITQIALRLAFNDASNFSRAFQRFYSQSPTAYRETHKH